MTRETAYCFAADLGGTKLAAAMADARGRIVAELTEPTDRRGGAYVAEQIAACADKLAQAVGIACVFACGAEFHTFLTIKHRLAVTDRRRAFAHNLAGLAIDGRIQLTLGNSLIDEPPVSRGRSIDEPARDKHVECERAANGRKLPIGFLTEPGPNPIKYS
jgi:hypothetical protein